MEIRGLGKNEEIVEQEADAFALTVRIDTKKKRELKSYEISDLKGYGILTFYFKEQKLEFEYFELQQLNNSPYTEGFVSTAEGTLKCRRL